MLNCLLQFGTFSDAIKYAADRFTSDTVHTPKWQGVDISKKAEMAMHELLFYSFMVPIGTHSLKDYQEDIKPNLPWADQHFEKDRISGHPLNPGETWQDWPYALKANTFRDERGQFNHSYAERYWPRLANCYPEGRLPEDTSAIVSKHGIRYRYGDLSDLLVLLHADPLTRQAYLPVWFPEDTGQPENGRKPCTLGYHFIMRDNKLHITYYIRSCDFVRHFREDLYLTVRLNLWVLDKLRKMGKEWENVGPGNFIFHCQSLHMFRNDYINLRRAS